MSVYSNEINEMVNKLLEKAICQKTEEKAFIPKDLTLLNFFLLKKIHTANQIVLTDLIDEIGIDYNKIRKEISTLEEKGYIIRKEDPKDKRRKFIQITQSGEKEIDKVTDSIEEKIQFVINNFSVNEEKAVLKFLSRINQLTYDHSKNKKDIIK